MAVEWYVLVGVGWLAVDIELKCAVWIVNDFHVEHSYMTILLDFLGPLDVWVNGVEVVVIGYGLCGLQ